MLHAILSVSRYMKRKRIIREISAIYAPENLILLQEIKLEGCELLARLDYRTQLKYTVITDAVHSVSVLIKQAKLEV